MPIILKHIVVCDSCQREVVLFASTNADIPAAREFAKDKSWAVWKEGIRYLFLCPDCQQKGVG